VKGRSLSFLAAFVIILTAWIWLTVKFYAPIRPSPTALTLGSGFVGTTQLPKEEITRHLDDAHSRMLAINRHGQEFSVAGASAVGWRLLAPLSSP
jgi:hypothetical protein